ncbi:hypothetical protein NIES37_19770 [Tolypothrix tenuis PCC 7101]|uniref:NTP pyrophosphohydrolase MazG putative catalytic core domain-containing protein n=1 Tax=Tolypothrix tenuis PCC 7101 TaxID=231146 RepID=A0A1Z4MX63_9CYAN|nr:hypothetical protein [Aulosira sp. FACHB-113]BAY98029.1 hypothetical protein NIES37_19770 [Tolypothrix tenuis PCC 7101]BAZ71464.1 hypothetical protein NIES50_00070 [Aulosira laxa NIES-50]
MQLHDYQKKVEATNNDSDYNYEVKISSTAGMVLTQAEEINEMIDKLLVDFKPIDREKLTKKLSGLLYWSVVLMNHFDVNIEDIAKRSLD